MMIGPLRPFLGNCPFKNFRFVCYLISMCMDMAHSTALAHSTPMIASATAYELHMVNGGRARVNGGRARVNGVAIGTACYQEAR